VEHVKKDGKVLRQLVFLESAGLVQSEVEVESTSTTEWKILNNYLTCEHHRLMLTAIDFTELKAGSETDKFSRFRNAISRELRFAVLGLGGGLLARFLYERFPRATIKGVELDPEVVEIAEKHFGFPSSSKNDGRVRVVVDDALNFLKAAAHAQPAEKVDVLFVDLSTNSHEEGITCPPPAFVTEEALRLMKDSLTEKGKFMGEYFDNSNNNLGVLSFNLVSRDAEISAGVKKTVKSIFPHIFSVRGEEDVNEVIICPVDIATNDQTNGNKCKEIITDCEALESKGEWMSDYYEMLNRLSAI